MFGSLLFICSYFLGTSLVYLSLLLGGFSLAVAPARATSSIRASQVHRGIVCRFQEHWWLFGGDRVSIWSSVGTVRGIVYQSQNSVWISQGIKLS